MSRLILCQLFFAVMAISTGCCHFSAPNCNQLDVTIASESRIIVAGNKINFGLSSGSEENFRERLHLIVAESFNNVYKKHDKSAVVTVLNDNIRFYFLFAVVQALAREVNYVEMPVNDGSRIRLSAHVFDPYFNGCYFIDDVEIVSGETNVAVKYGKHGIACEACKMILCPESEREKILTLFCYDMMPLSDVIKTIHIVHEKGWECVNLVPMSSRGTIMEENSCD